MTDQVEEPEEQADKPRSNSRLCLANRTHMKRKFPKPPGGISRVQLLSSDTIPHSNVEGKEGQAPAHPLLSKDDREASNRSQYKVGQERAELPDKRKRKLEPSVKRIVCQGWELFELGQNGWTETVRKMWEHNQCEALAECRASISGSHVSKDTVLNPMIPYVPPTFPDSSSEEEREVRKQKASNKCNEEIPSPSSSADFQ